MVRAAAPKIKAGAGHLSGKIIALALETGGYKHILE
jgi:hypothetical protein